MLGRTGPAPHHGSTIGSVLLAEVWVRQLLSCEHRRDVSISYLYCGGMGRGMKACPCPSMLEAGGRVGPVSVGGAFLTPTSYNTRKNGSFTSPGHHNRVKFC